MPFDSEKQRRYLWARKPSAARKKAEGEKREKKQRKAGRKGGRKQQMKRTGGYKSRKGKK